MCVRVRVRASSCFNLCVRAWAESNLSIAYQDPNKLALFFTDHWSSLMHGSSVFSDSNVRRLYKHVFINLCAYPSV